MLQTAPVFPQFSVRYMLFGSSYLNRACQGHIYFQNVFILEPKSLKTLHTVIWDLLKKFPACTQTFLSIYKEGRTGEL